MGYKSVRENDCNKCTTCGNTKIDQDISIGPTGARFYVLRCLYCGLETEPVMIQGEAIKLWNELNDVLIAGVSRDALVMRLEEIEDKIDEFQNSIDDLYDERDDIECKLKSVGTVVY
jgi:hypothetical protein